MSSSGRHTSARGPVFALRCGRRSAGSECAGAPCLDASTSPLCARAPQEQAPSRRRRGRAGKHQAPPYHWQRWWQRQVRLLKRAQSTPPQPHGADRPQLSLLCSLSPPTTSPHHPHPGLARAWAASSSSVPSAFSPLAFPPAPQSPHDPPPHILQDSSQHQHQHQLDPWQQQQWQQEQWQQQQWQQQQWQQQQWQQQWQEQQQQQQPVLQPQQWQPPQPPQLIPHPRQDERPRSASWPSATSSSLVAPASTYSSMNSLLRTLHDERVAAGRQGRWTEVDDEDDDDL